MAKVVENFDEWTGGLTEEEIKIEIEKLRKRFWLFFGLGLVPGLNLVFMGLAAFCSNNLAILKSHGQRSTSTGMLWFMMLYGFFMPCIIVPLCSKINKLGNAVLGWK